MQVERAEEMISTFDRCWDLAPGHTDVFGLRPLGLRPFQA